MVKKIKLSWVIAFIMVIITCIVIFANRDTKQYTFNIPKPEKIIIYNYGNSKTIDETNKNFNELIKLISMRIEDSEKLIISKHKNKYIDNEKFAWACLEFIYEKPTSFEITKDKTIKCEFKKLYFLISAEGAMDYGYNMYYGDDDYIHCLESVHNGEKIMSKIARVINREVKSK